jgi:hypothetical protein
MERSGARPGGIPCQGCPIYPHIRDEEFRFPSCELCHWPAVGIGLVHAWRCAYCRHRNQHGQVRPRVAVTMLRLADLDPAAHQLEVVDVRYGHYAAGRAGLALVEPHPAGQQAHRDPDGCPGAVADLLLITRESGAPFRNFDSRSRELRRGPPSSGRAGRPVYARATAGGLPVLIVGGDRPYPHPLGLSEHDPSPSPSAAGPPGSPARASRRHRASTARPSTRTSSRRRSPHGRRQPDRAAAALRGPAARTRSAAPSAWSGPAGR